ncbi:MAG: RNA polymerase sigma factor [Candidatus Poribacteria bacterium]|nr:RNA polymerase sigma factor [Candidatus Poribacteria bacterium]
MENNDVQLIRRILSGDDAAFTALVGKYQKSVHALAWRKIGDFHFAEEVTQDTFLQAYKKLATLRNPNQFAGWLYVIATNLCNRWLQKKKLPTQSLEGTSVVEIENASYKRYASEQRETETAEHHHEIVKNLLQRLPENERTVVTLHYLGEMTIKEISKFLGVSANTINSRLRRARARLQEREELLIQEMLGSVQLPVNLIENIARQVANIKPTPATPIGKPLVPWTALGTAAVLIIFGLGVGNQYLAHYQKPYSFEADFEPTIEIVDAPIVLDIDAKLALQNQFGRTVIPNKQNRTSLSVDAETPSVPQSEKRFFGLTLAEIEAEIPDLEKEIRTNLIKASALYTELRNTDGTAGMSSRIATWRDETWKEVQRLFHDVANTGKILRYRSYLRVTGVEKDPILPGGWIYALMEPLPMRITPNSTFNESFEQDSTQRFPNEN